MVQFDWETFLRQHRIEYVTTGPNASKDHINIACPFCGNADPSQHLGISTKGQGYYCFRSQAHGGRSPVRLVRQLIHCDEVTARRIVYGTAPNVPTEDALSANIRAIRAADEVQVVKPQLALKLPKEFKPLLSGSSLARPFLDYLRQRGHSEANIRWLAQTYQLHYVTQGLFAYRLIIPIFDRKGELLTWTGRTIQLGVEPRYRALGMPRPDHGPPFARYSIKDTLLGLPLLWEAEPARVLIVCEGPFDAWRISSLGRGFGVYGTCIFGLSVQDAQIELLQQLSSRFKKMVLLLDPDAEMYRLRFYERLATVKIEISRLPFAVKDPAELSTDQTLALCVDLLGNS